MPIFKPRLPDSEPLVEQVLQSPEYLQCLEFLGQAGWEMVAIQPCGMPLHPQGMTRTAQPAPIPCPVDF